MPASTPRILVTAATGRLGRLVIEHLLEAVPPERLVATTRDPAKAAATAARGVEVRVADYARPETLDAAFAGVERVLLISSSAHDGQRVPQHSNAIEAARRAGVQLLAYTSLLHADTSPLGLAGDHRDTEALLRASGVPFVILRNGWYTENHAAFLPAALKRGAFIGAAGEGRLSWAARADYAAAAAAVLTSGEDLSGRTFELAGDEAATLAELVAEAARQSGQPLAYRNLPQAEFAAALAGASLPADFAALLANSDAGAAQGALLEGSRQLSALIGRPTTPIAASITGILAAR